LHAYTWRSEQRSIFKDAGLRGSPYLHLAVGGSLALQLLTIFSPVLRRLLGTAPLHWTDLLSIAGGSVLPFVVNEATKSATEAA